MRITVLALALLAVLASSAQPLKQRGPSAGGTVSLGVRSSFSLFSSGDHGAPGTGAGGQARFRISDRVNTDWFYDYFTGPAGSLAHREDQHIGWSVLFYMRKPSAERQRLQPYVLAGHCFDYSKQQSIAEPENFAERWSSAVQAGLGTHLNVTDRADFSLVCQYMAHLGTDIHADEHDGEVHFHKEKGADLEGHLLIHMSFNYKIADLW